MKISLKSYNKIRLVLVVIMSMIFSQSIIFENFIIPIFVMIIWSLTLFYLRSKVTEIIADERDYVLAWKSSFLAIQVFSWISVILMFVLYAFKNENQYFEIIAEVLAFSVCIIMILYSFIFSFLNKNWIIDKNLILRSLFLIFLFWSFTFIFFNKLFYNENKNIENTNIQPQSEYRIEKVLDIDCEIDDDCETPWEYLIRSNCPYTSKCLNKKCNVICPKF